MSDEPKMLYFRVGNRDKFVLLFEFHLKFQYHVFHILVNALEVGIQDAFPCVYRRGLVEGWLV